MRTSELAALAGVTIRTLRHYHQVGLLEEPERSTDDYGEYEVRHLARLLRIIRLAELGVPLAELPEVLDDPDAAADLLDRLDQEATAGIQRLTCRRAVIAVLRQHGAVPDLPPATVRSGEAGREWVGSEEAGPEEPGSEETGSEETGSEEPRREAVPLAAAAADVAPDLVRYEREQLALLAHLVGEARTAALTRTLARVAPLTPGSAELLRRFAALGPDTPDGDVERLADEMTDRYRPLLDALPDVEIGHTGAPLLAAYMGQTGMEQTGTGQTGMGQIYNEQQVRVLCAFEERVRGA